MLSTLKIDFVIYILIFQCRICLGESGLKYSVSEEQPVGFVLGNINDHVMSNLNGYQQYDVSLMHNYFEILSNKDLVIKKLIDLETFCNDAHLCCDVNQCIISFIVLVNFQNSPRNQFNVRVEILDINDNKPSFKNPTQTVFFSENSAISTSMNIEGGFDNDFSLTNQIQRYTFREETMTFTLDSNDMASLSVVLKKTIDFERQSVYGAVLSACDSDARCVDQPMIINIQDENDNYPVFGKQKYEAQILESFEVGKVVIAARATDLDGAQFNKTRYGFHDNRDRNIQSKFRIGQNSGDIVLMGKLDAQQRQVYTFKIYAIDAVRTVAGKKDIADVTITVLDINDHVPVIEVFHSKRVTNNKETFEIKIPENENPQKLMSIQVTDTDLDQNAKVRCDLRDPSGTLELKLLNRIYDINSNRQFDYEQETQIKATLTCADSGSPPLSADKSITITIEDVNEFSPVFDQSEFHGSVPENRVAGEVVLSVRAFDKDGASVLTYSLEESVTEYFAINPSTGVIKTASLSFDREMIASKSFRVTVTDSFVNPRSADAMVRINILDENDNDPIFVVSSLNFFISENQVAKTRLQGQLVATDSDKDHKNSFLIYSLIETYDSQLKKCERPYFVVNVNGGIESLSPLDRETNANFTLTIEARDNGKPPRFSRANATVIIHDVNDNSPQWKYPRQSLIGHSSANSIPVLNLTESERKFALIMQVKALDPDQNEAGRVSYVLVDHQHALFSLNDTTGELRVEKSPLPYGQFQLQLRASDHGNPPRRTDSWIIINIRDSGKYASINLTIIIGMVAITVLISIFLIVAIICVRRRPRYQQSYMAPEADISKDQANQYFTHNQWMYQQTDDPGMPPLSDNESCIYLSGNYYEQQDPLILHSLTGSRPASRIDYPLVLPSSHHSSEHKFGSQSGQNAERTTGTLRSNNGQYFSVEAPSSGIIINGQELDGDSADSGKGASEVDLRLQYHLNNVTRNYPTMPFPHHSNASSLFNYQQGMPDSQCYSVNTNPKSFDSRFLTVNPSNLTSKRRVVSPKFNSNNNHCQCFILPEDDVIEVGHDSNHVPMTTFSQQSIATVKSPTTSNHHDRNCVYRDDILSTAAVGYYSHCPYNQGPSSRMSHSPVPFNTGKDSTNIDQDTSAGENLNGVDPLDSYNKSFDITVKNNFTNSEPMTQEKNIYTLGLAN